MLTKVAYFSEICVKFQDQTLNGSSCSCLRN